jgi:hypothetical protein
MRASTKSLLVALAALGATALVAETAQAADLVTYSWTTTSKGFGSHLDQPTAATFQVALSAVQAGSFGANDITNIQLTYPGLTFNNFVVSSIGFDNAVFVNPVTGALVFHDVNQGLAVIGQDTTDPNFSTFLSILVDNQKSGAVKDTFNALNHGTPWAGFPTAGFWTATLPDVGTGGGVPEPAAWALMITGFGLAGGALRRRRGLGANA